MKTKLTIIAILLTVTLQAQITEPIPYDKKWHIGAGAVAGVWGTFMGDNLQLTPEQSALIGVGVGFAAGIGKELMDVGERFVFKVDNRFDPMDIAATTLGGVIGAGLSYAALKIFKKPPVIFSLADTKSIQVGVKIRL